MTASLVDRFAAKIVPDGDCWRWTGSQCSKGYGRLAVDRVPRLAHRWSYEYHRAELGDGVQVDHLCRNSWCVNPWHLEPVSPAENRRRQREAVTHCKRGHEFAPENTYTAPDGTRRCRTCYRAWWGYKGPQV